MSVTTAEPASDLAIIPANPVALFTDGEQFDSFYDKIKAETDAFTPDLSTDTSRKAIASMAFRVTKTKTALDAAGKALIEDARKQVDQVNAARRVMRERLEALADDVRRPLTEWEERERQRIARCEAVMQWLREAARVDLSDTCALVATRGAEVETTVLDAAEFGELLEIAQQLREAALLALAAAVARLSQEEAEREELARLRAEAEERRVREESAAARAEAERIAAEQAEQECLTAERRRQQEEADAEAERQRIADAAEQARVQAIREAEEAAAAELCAAEAKAAEELRLANEASAAQQAELQAQIEAANRREIERQRADQALADKAERVRREGEARTADRAHRSEIMGASKAAIMAQGATEKLAKAIVLAIVAGEIPHTRITF